MFPFNNAWWGYVFYSTTYTTDGRAPLKHLQGEILVLLCTLTFDNNLAHPVPSMT